MIPFTISNGTLTVFLNGRPQTVDRSHVSYDTIVEKLKAGETDGIEDLLDVRTAISAKLEKYGDVEVGYDTILYKGHGVSNYLVDVIFRLLAEGFDITPWALFLDNLMKNPSKTAVDELYLWLEKAQMPLTPDGCFLAYKKVRDDYGSYYDNGKTMNSIGSVVEMPRNAVDDRR
ncbi:hypothetical protein ACUN0C_20205, partial [Faunimonas sp. B44]